jgi:hypothetical protein
VGRGQCLLLQAKEKVISNTITALSRTSTEEIPRLTVPVARTSPGMSVWPSLIVMMRYGTLKIRSSVVAFWRSSPLT